LLEVAEQVRVAEGAAVVEDTLLVVIQEAQALRAHPRCRDHRLGRVEAPVAEHLVDGPGDALRRRNDRRMVQSSAELVAFHRAPPSCSRGKRACTYWADVSTPVTRQCLPNPKLPVCVQMTAVSAGMTMPGEYSAQLTALMLVGTIRLPAS